MTPNRVFRCLPIAAVSMLVLAAAACDGDDTSEPLGTMTQSATVSPTRALGTPAALSDARTTELGREVAALIADGNADGLWDRFDELLRDVIGSPDEGVKSLETFREAYGAQGDRESETADRIDNYSMYRASFAYENADEPVNFVVGFNDDESVAELSIEPSGPAPTEHLDYQTKTDLRLPFAGEWFVFWGGRTEELNYHVISVDQRFAYDIVIQKEGVSHAGDGKENEDYYCYGQPLVAPGAGTVSKRSRVSPTTFLAKRIPPSRRATPSSSTMATASSQ